MLVVDDNATNRRILALQAAKWGMVARDTETAGRGAALARRRRDRSTWRSSTCTCPGMDGRDAGRSASALPATPCRWCCSARSAGARLRDTEGLFAATLAKPLRQSQLFDTLVGLLAHDDSAARPSRLRGQAAELDAQHGRSATRCASCSPKTTW